MAAVVWNLAVLHRVLQSPSGPVARDLARRAVQVETAAKISLNASFPPASLPGEPPHKRTAHLQTSISWRIGEDSEGLYAAIGTDLPYGKYLELGTETLEPRPYLRPALAAARS